MTKEEWKKLFALAKEHEEEFGRWWAKARPDMVKGYCQLGWLIENKVHGQEQQGRQPAKSREMASGTSVLGEAVQSAGLSEAENE